MKIFILFVSFIYLFIFFNIYDFTILNTYFLFIVFFVYCFNYARFV